MVTFNEIGLPFFIASSAIILYFIYKLPKIIHRSKLTKQDEGRIYRKSLVSHVLYDLGKTPPHYSRLLAMMQNDLKHTGDKENKRLQAFLEDSERHLRGVKDASTISRLYNRYYSALAAIKKIEGE